MVEVIRFFYVFLIHVNSNFSQFKNFSGENMLIRIEFQGVVDDGSYHSTSLAYNYDNNSTPLPQVGDSIEIHETTFSVKERCFMPEKDTLIIKLSFLENEPKRELFYTDPLWFGQKTVGKYHGIRGPESYHQL
jgi:hypothetical protein